MAVMCRDPESKESRLQCGEMPEEVLRSVASYQNKMARILLEMSCLEGIERLRDDKALPAFLLRRFAKIVDLFDESTQYMLGQMRRRGVIVRCQQKCIHCCHDMPSGMTAIELIYLYHGLHVAGNASRLIRRCLEAEEVWGAALERSRFYRIESGDGAPDQVEIDAALEAYQVIRQACPFLERDLCLVYPYRPLACRMHFSTSSPAWCNPDHFQHDYAIRFNLLPGDCVYDALEHLDERFRLNLSEVMVCGLLELAINVMQFDAIRWVA